MKKIVILTTVILSVVATSQAAIYWDNGGADNDWHTAANWDGNTVPTSGDVTALNGDYAAEVTGAAVSSTLYVGLNGNASLAVQSGGSQTASGTVIVGANSGNVGTVNVSGGSLNWAGIVNLGSSGTGYLNMTSGTASMGDLFVAKGGTGNGTMTISGTAVVNTTNLKLAEIVGGTGTLNINGGSLTSTTTAYIGNRGDGFANQTAGTYTVSASGGLVLGALGEFGSGTYTISGGTLDVTGAGGIRVGVTGAGTLKVVGDDATITATKYVSTTTSTNDPRVATLISEIDADGISLIDIAGTATLYGNYNILGSAAAVGTYTILTAAGGITEDFDNVTVDGVDIDTLPFWSYEIVGNSLIVTVTLEPSMMLIFSQHGHVVDDKNI